jgi:DNA-binding CsgD family transcriptional regulator
VGSGAAELRRRVLTRARVVLEGGDVEIASWIASDLARMGGATEAASLADDLSGSASRIVRLRVLTLRAMADPANAGAVGLAELGAEWQEGGCLLHAAELYAMASDVARRSGARREASGYLGRSQSLAEQTQRAATALLRFAETAEPLTAREREIAQLAARGHSSNEIAGLLFLSPRTVNNHLQAVYWKLGVRRRTELAEALGLVATQ